MKLVCLLILFLSFSSVYPDELPLVEKLRPTLSRVIGVELTNKLIGKLVVIKLDQGIILPVLPKVSNDAKSTDIYTKKKKDIVLKNNQEEKYYLTYIKEIYEATRQTKPSDEEISKLMNVLTQGGTREGIYHSLVLDSVYAGLENTDKVVKANAIDFAIYFLERYVGKKATKESFKEMNIYSLKRILADKSLDIIDAFADNREDLEKWYAVMSSDFALKFPLLWTGKMRKDNSGISQKIWASKVPLQHIKSETVIKIHNIFNSMR